MSLGGAYEEPENAHQAAISKIARQFMTRLHIQVNQTMQFYRGQQGGSAPQRLFLSGGASIMPYTAQFFAEKLNVPVEYFNPFRNVQIDPSINLEELARVAHSLGEVVGLGLRNLAHCPVELNLMPESTVNWVQFNQKKPYFIASLFSLVLVVFAAGFIFQKLADLNTNESDKLKKEVMPLKMRHDRFTRATGERDATLANAARYAEWVEDRYYWGDVLSNLHEILIQVEANKAAELNQPVGLWIERFTSDPSHVETVVAVAPEPTPQPEPATPVVPAVVAPATMTSNPHWAEQSTMIKDYYTQHPNEWADYVKAVYHDIGPATTPKPATVTEQPAEAPKPARKNTAAAASTSGGASVGISCCGVDMSAITGNSSVDRDIINDFVNALQNSPMFDKDTQPPTTFETNANGTFSFDLTLKLKRALKL